jgi:hypothetical protein
VQVALELCPQFATARGERGRVALAEVGEVVGHGAIHCLTDDLERATADALDPLEFTASSLIGDLFGRESFERGRSLTEGLHLEAHGEFSLEPKRDFGKGRYRIHQEPISIRTA